jgi:hypothetical protein
MPSLAFYNTPRIILATPLENFFVSLQVNTLVLHQYHANEVDSVKKDSLNHANNPIEFSHRFFQVVITYYFSTSNTVN